ncbi:MAG: energy transducer TonB [Gallionella sp.]
MSSISFSMAFSVAFHAFAMFGIALVLPDPRINIDTHQALQVVLVNSKSESSPVDADALAQANLDGGGNTEKDLQAKTPLPTIRDDEKFTPEKNPKTVAQLENETKQMLAKLKSDYNIVQPELKMQKSITSLSGDDLVQKSLEIAKLEAQIEQNINIYQKLPRRKFVGARTTEYRFAQYIEDWRVKVERIGNLNYPEQARRKKIYGKLQLSVSIHKDGSIEAIEVSKSSGKRILDAAAIRIVRLGAPYSLLPPSITKDTDILTITRTWTFTSSDQLESN